MSSLPNFVAPSLEELSEEFEFVRNCSYLGIPGVARFSSDVPGPCLGITVQTHGNEPSGLAALRHFRLACMADRLLCGSVFFVLNNVRAAEAYFRALGIEDEAERNAAKMAARFSSINMNRLPADTFDRVNDASYEVVRAHELGPLWRRFTVALDIHTTRSKTPGMIVAIGGVEASLYRGFPADVVIRNIENVQTGKPACAFYGDPGVTPVFGIEAGTHEDPAAFEMAFSSSVALMRNLGMLPFERPSAPRQGREYRITSSVFFPNDSFLLSRAFGNFERVAAGEILAEGQGANPILMPADGHVVFAPPGRKHTSKLSDEVLFLSAPCVPVEI